MFCNDSFDDNIMTDIRYPYDRKPYSNDLTVCLGKFNGFSEEIFLYSNNNHMYFIASDTINLMVVLEK